jgi:anti-sigma factor RsiW
MWGTRRRRAREAEELAALADGSLAPERRAALEARVAASPRLRALLREQEEAVAAVRLRAEPAPQRLHDAIVRMPERPRRLRPAGAAVAVVTAVAAAAVGALVLPALPGSEQAAPTLAAATALGARSITSARPVSRPSTGKGHPMLAGVGVEGVRYPDWRREYGFRAIGSRTDRLGSRRATTVFYVKGGRRVAYTVLSGGPVNIPRGSRPVRWKGKLRHVFTANGRVAVTWQRRGHTCIVSGHGLRRHVLVKLTA